MPIYLPGDLLAVIDKDFLSFPIVSASRSIRKFGAFTMLSARSSFGDKTYAVLSLFILQIGARVTYHEANHSSSAGQRSRRAGAGSASNQVPCSQYFLANAHK